MKILGIETSCDETAVCLIEAEKNSDNSTKIEILGDALFSQASIHAEYGGVFPALAKREHAKNITSLLSLALKNYHSKNTENPEGKHKVELSREDKEKIEKILEREVGLGPQVIEYLENNIKPDIDAIAVTNGPGLEPALWVGISFAKALSVAWNIPVVPTNHMEGHIVASLLNSSTLEIPLLPAISLLISGGHTELVLMDQLGSYKIIGATKDDAVGEAFDKVARMLELPYPGGPHVSRLADLARVHEEKTQTSTPKVILPRPMIKSGDLNFSFSGLKTAVLYLIKKTSNINEDFKQNLACEFENSVTEVLVTKTRRAVIENNAQSIILGGGVTANSHIRSAFEKLAGDLNVKIYLPSKDLSTDNAVMIALAGYLNFISKNTSASSDSLNNLEMRAEGNLKL